MLRNSLQVDKLLKDLGNAPLNYTLLNKDWETIHERFTNLGGSGPILKSFYDRHVESLITAVQFHSEAKRNGDAENEAPLTIQEFNQFSAKILTQFRAATALPPGAPRRPAFELYEVYLRTLFEVLRTSLWVQDINNNLNRDFAEVEKSTKEFDKYISELKKSNEEYTHDLVPATRSLDEEWRIYKGAKALLSEIPKNISVCAQASKYDIEGFQRALNNVKECKKQPLYDLSQAIRNIDPDLKMPLVKSCGEDLQKLHVLAQQDKANALRFWEDKLRISSVKYNAQVEKIQLLNTQLNNNFKKQYKSFWIGFLQSQLERAVANECKFYDADINNIIGNKNLSEIKKIYTDLKLTREFIIGLEISESQFQASLGVSNDQLSDNLFKDAFYLAKNYMQKIKAKIDNNIQQCEKCFAQKKQEEEKESCNVKLKLLQAALAEKVPLEQKLKKLIALSLSLKNDVNFSPAVLQDLNNFFDLVETLQRFEGRLKELKAAPDLAIGLYNEILEKLDKCNFQLTFLASFKSEIKHYVQSKRSLIAVGQTAEDNSPLKIPLVSVALALEIIHHSKDRIIAKYNYSDPTRLREGLTLLEQDLQRLNALKKKAEAIDFTQVSQYLKFTTGVEGRDLIKEIETLIEDIELRKKDFISQYNYRLDNLKILEAELKPILQEVQATLDAKPHAALDQEKDLSTDLYKKLKTFRKESMQAFLVKRRMMDKNEPEFKSRITIPFYQAQLKVGLARIAFLQSSLAKAKSTDVFKLHEQLKLVGKVFLQPVLEKKLELAPEEYDPQPIIQAYLALNLRLADILSRCIQMLDKPKEYDVYALYIRIMKYLQTIGPLCKDPELKKQLESLQDKQVKYEASSHACASSPAPTVILRKIDPDFPVGILEDHSLPPAERKAALATRSTPLEAKTIQPMPAKTEARADEVSYFKAFMNGARKGFMVGGLVGLLVGTVFAPPTWGSSLFASVPAAMAVALLGTVIGALGAVITGLLGGAIGVMIKSLAHKGTQQQLAICDLKHNSNDFDASMPSAGQERLYVSQHLSIDRIAVTNEVDEINGPQASRTDKLRSSSIALSPVCNIQFWTPLPVAPKDTKEKEPNYNKPAFKSSSR